NINNLQDPSFIPAFILLLKVLSPEISNDDAIHLATLVNRYSQPKTTEDDNFLFSHQRLATITELKRLPEFTSIYAKLSPHIIALPETTPININTASKIVLMSLGLTESQAETIIERRTNQAFKSVQEL